MSTDAEKLAQIAALCDDLEIPGTSFGAAKRLRAILAEPGPAVPPHAIDREALERTLRAWLEARPEETFAQGVDRILALVRPVEGVTLRRCSWDECPGFEKSIPIHEQEDGPELHGVCKAAMISPEAVRELTLLYASLAAERKARPAGVTLTDEETDTVLKVLRWAADFTGVRDYARLKALAARLEASA